MQFTNEIATLTADSILQMTRVGQALNLSRPSVVKEVEEASEALRQAQARLSLLDERIRALDKAVSAFVREYVESEEIDF